MLFGKPGVSHSFKEEAFLFPLPFLVKKIKLELCKMMLQGKEYIVN